MDTLPIISLWQPYASLIFTKMLREPGYVKRHETRNRPPPLKYVGGYIGILATAKFPPAKKIPEELHDLCMDIYGCSYNHTLPLGALIGVVRISGGLSTNEHKPAHEEDRIAGDWRPNRFAWPLSDVTPLPVPLPMKGAQSWKLWEIPTGFKLDTPIAA